MSSAEEGTDFADFATHDRAFSVKSVQSVISFLYSRKNRNALKLSAEPFWINHKKRFPAVAVTHIHCLKSPQFANFPAERFARTPDHSSQLGLTKINSYSFMRLHSYSSG